MRVYNIKLETLKKLRELTEISKSVNILYKKLFDLESRGLHGTKEYKQTINYLKITIEVENEEYNAMYLTGHEYDELMEYLCQNFETEDDIFPFSESVIEQDYQKVVDKRVISLLHNRFAYEFERDRKKEATMEDFSDVIEISEESLTRKIDNCITLQKMTGGDVAIIWLLFLQKIYNNEKLKIFKKDAIKTKYYMSFINKDIEEFLIENEFDLSIIQYIVNSVSFLNPVTRYKDFYQYNIDSFCSENAYIQFEKLLDLNDKNYDDGRIIYSSILRQYLIRTNFILMSEKELEESNYLFHEIMETKYYRKAHRNDKISENLIIQAFQSIKKDRENNSLILLNQSSLSNSNDNYNSGKRNLKI